MKIRVLFKAPIKIVINNIAIRWRYIIQLLSSLRLNGIKIDGWLFSLDYGIIYINERDSWDCYNCLGIADKRILSIGGGCGEDAKYFIEHGAKSVHVIENNLICEQYLLLNSKNHRKLTYEITDFNPDKIKWGYYDLVKLDIEGYEIRLLNFEQLNKLKLDIVLEAHSNYIVDKFINNGFSTYYRPERNKEIYGGNAKLYRSKDYAKRNR